MPSLVQPRASQRALRAPFSGARNGGSRGCDLKLMDGVLKRIARARAHLADARHESQLDFYGSPADKDGADHVDSRATRLLDSAVMIVEQLRSSLDLHQGGPFAVNLDDLFGYMSRQLGNAGYDRDVTILDEVSHLLREVRSVHVMLPGGTYV